MHHVGISAKFNMSASTSYQLYKTRLASPLNAHRRQVARTAFDKFYSYLRLLHARNWHNVLLPFERLYERRVAQFRRLNAGIESLIV